MTLKTWLKNKKIEKPSEIVDIVQKIFEFNKQNQQGQGQGLKSVTPDQMLSRLPIKIKGWIKSRK